MDSIEYLKGYESDLDLAVSSETIISFLIEKGIISSSEEFNKRYDEIKNGPVFGEMYNNVHTLRMGLSLSEGFTKGLNEEIKKE